MNFLLFIALLLVCAAFFIYSVSGTKAQKLPNLSTTKRYTDHLALAYELRKPVPDSKKNEVIHLNEPPNKKEIDFTTRDFIVFDFETANIEKHSACALGIAIVKDLKIVDTKSYLISPPHDNYFLQRFVDLHKITWADVYNKPFFSEIWHQVEPLFLNNLCIAYNNSFDNAVLLECLNFYGIPLQAIDCCCAYQLSKQNFKGVENYKLSSICEHLNIELDHHQAESDAIGTAHIVIHLVNELITNHLLLEEKNERSVKNKERIQKSRDLKEAGLSVKVENCKRNLRRNRAKIKENPDEEQYRELYKKYKDDYFILTGEEYLD